MLVHVDFGSDRSVHRLSVGPTHSCARLDNGEVKCWGANDRFQLGLGDNLARGAAPATMGDRLAAVWLLPGPYVQSTSRPTAAPTRSPNSYTKPPAGSALLNLLALCGIIAAGVLLVGVASFALFRVVRRAARAKADSTRVAVTAL